MKRITGAVFAMVLVFSALFTLHASAESAASKIDMYCTVNADGDCLVSMTVNLRIEAADPGLTFPLPYSASNITMNGSSTASSRVGDKTQVAVGKVTGGMTGEFPLRFDFILPKAVAVTADRQLQLTIPMLCGFDYPVESLSFIITLPDTVETKPLFTSTYQQVGFESSLELATNGNMITGASTKALNDHESVTMTMPVAKEMFPTVSTYQRNGNPEIIPMAILAGAALLYWLIFLRTLPPHRQRATVPPEGISAGELGCRVTMAGGDLSMMVLSWAQMGYLLIRPQGGRVILYKQMDMGNERSLFEVRVFQTLFANRQAVDCRSLGYAKLCAKTASMVPGEKTMCRSRPGSRKVFRLLLCLSQLFCGICVAMNMTSIAVLQIMFSFIFGLLSIISAWEIQEFAMHILFRSKLRCWIALGVCLFWVLPGAVSGQPWVPLVSVTVQLLMGFLAAFGGMRTELNRSEAGEILAIRRFLKSIPRPEAARLIKSDPEYFFRMAPYAIALGVGKCICKDGLAPVLEEIRNADGLIIGSPNYLGDMTAGFRALFERLIFQSLTYKTEFRSYNQKQIPVLMIMTSNASEDFYVQIGYDQMLQRYQGSFNTFVGPTKILISSDTLQVKDYRRYNWTMFDPEHKKEHHETVFPEDKKRAFALGEQMVSGTWE